MLLPIENTLVFVLIVVMLGVLYFMAHAIWPYLIKAWGIIGLCVCTCVAVGLCALGIAGITKGETLLGGLFIASTVFFSYVFFYRYCRKKKPKNAD